MARGNFSNHPSYLKTHCKRGHALTPDNVYWDKYGRRRRCKICCNFNQRDRRFQRQYNITEKQYEELKLQGCAICGKTDLRMHNDHDHKTEKYRELLCINCNVTLGLVNENIEILEKMIEYLRKHNAKE